MVSGTGAVGVDLAQALEVAEFAVTVEIATRLHHEAVRIAADAVLIVVRLRDREAERSPRLAGEGGGIGRGTCGWGGLQAAPAGVPVALGELGPLDRGLLRDGAGERAEVRARLGGLGAANERS